MWPGDHPYADGHRFEKEAGGPGVCVLLLTGSDSFLRLMSEEKNLFSIFSTQVVLLCAHETLQPSIPLQRAQRQSEANAVSEIEWLWEHGEASPNTHTLPFPGQNQNDTVIHSTEKQRGF